MDSCKILSDSLLRICKNMKLINQKKDSNCIKELNSYEDFLKNKKVIIEYFKYDIFSLSEAIIKIRHFFLEKEIDIIHYYTIGMISM